VLWSLVLTVKVPQHATSYAEMELIAYGGTDTHHGRKILWRKIQREGGRELRIVTVSHAPTRRAFPSVRFDHLAYFHNGLGRRENRPDTSVLLFSSISYATPAPRRVAVIVVNRGHGLQSPCQARRLSSQFLDEIVSSGIENWVPLFHVSLSRIWREILRS
jgi:hypothetical protein